jgi:hypothetical protein
VAQARSQVQAATRDAQQTQPEPRDHSRPRAHCAVRRTRSIRLLPRWCATANGPPHPARHRASVRCCRRCSSSRRRRGRSTRRRRACH